MIRNKTKNRIISNEYKLCSSIFSKGIGLMFQPAFKKPLIFIFKKERIVSLHMLFVFFPIDVLWLNRDKKVVELKRNLMPFSFYTPKKKAHFVIELSAGSIRRGHIALGDSISF